MDDVPSRPVEKTRSEHEAAGRDFYDLATDFTVLHRQIAKGVLDAVGELHEGRLPGCPPEGLHRRLEKMEG